MDTIWTYKRLPFKLTDRSILFWAGSSILLCSSIPRFKRIGGSWVYPRKRSQNFVIDLLHLTKCLLIHFFLLWNQMDALINASVCFWKSASLLRRWECLVFFRRSFEEALALYYKLWFLGCGKVGWLLTKGVIFSWRVKKVRHIIFKIIIYLLAWIYYITFRAWKNQSSNY